MGLTRDAACIFMTILVLQDQISLYGSTEGEELANDRPREIGRGLPVLEPIESPGSVDVQQRQGEVAAYGFLAGRQRCVDGAIVIEMWAMRRGLGDGAFLDRRRIRAEPTEEDGSV
jgi:hypothetical protein